MKRILIGLLALSCVVVLVPAAFAAEDAAGTPFFNPTLRVGVAFDLSDTHYKFANKGVPLFGLLSEDLKFPADARFYIATELPFAVTDRLTLALGADWSFSGTEKDIIEDLGFAHRSWERDGRADWVSADFLASYALVKNTGVIKDLSVVGGLRWDYQNMSLDNPRVTFGFVVNSPLDTFDFRMQTLAPVLGIEATFTGFKSGIWGGDVKLGVLAGPIVWGALDHRETFATPTFVFRFKDNVSHGYIVKVSGEMTLLSGVITPRLEGSLSLFADYTGKSVNGVVETKGYSGAFYATAPYDFETKSDVFTFGLSASLAFDLFGKPEPVAPAPAPAPVIEPKLEPMSKN
jgi:hypothetical protein